MAWEDVAEAMKPDGFFRDVRIVGASTEDWDAVLTKIAGAVGDPIYTIDGVPAPWSSAQQAVEEQQRASPLLRFVWGKIAFSCRFYSIDGLEFDFKITEPLADAEIGDLEEFIRLLGQMTGKRVEITCEGDDWAFAAFDPRLGQMQFKPWPKTGRT